MTASEKQPDLIAIDGSPAAEAASRFAIADARHDERPLVLIQVIDSANPEGEAIAKPSVTNALADAAKAGVTADVRTRHGPPCEEIMAAARELDPRFIFIGTCGVKGFTRVLLGSVSADLLRRVNWPLVVVPPTVLPQSSPDPLFARILVAIDPESEKTSPVESAIALAAATARELTSAPCWTSFAFSKWRRTAEDSVCKMFLPMCDRKRNGPSRQPRITHAHVEWHRRQLFSTETPSTDCVAPPINSPRPAS